MKTIALKTFVSRNEVLKLPGSDTVHMVPVQLIRFEDGTSALRIGDTAYWFNASGEYDGPEMNFDHGLSEEAAKGVCAKLELCRGTRDTRPETSYFEEGSPGYAAEVAGWPDPDREIH